MMKKETGVSHVKKFLVFFACFVLLTGVLFGQRHMENLGRGLVAVRSSGSQVFVSWRILGLEFNAGTKYNLYRGSTRVASDLNVSNYVDNTSANSTYQVAAVVGGSEQAKCPQASVTTYIQGSNTLPAQRVQIRNTGGYTPNLIWPGDLDGDGEYDFVFDKQPDDATQPILLEAYRRDGTFLWQLNCGPNSVNKDNIEPGSSALCIGHGDNVTVYDLDSDGKAEVIVRTSNGVAFPNGAALSEGDNNRQFISVLEGTTGKEIARAPVPADYLADGPLNGHMGIAYLDGVNPSVVLSAKNRVGSGDFNMVVAAWTLKGTTLSQNWKFLRPASTSGTYPDGHQIRCMDVDGDGRDEICPFGFMLDDNGRVLYSMADKGAYHGDRFSIGDLDPNRAGLEGYAIQQDNTAGLAWILYDARTGSILQSQYGAAGTDYARGCALDLDPRYRGFELYTFTDGLYNVNGTRITTALPDSYPNLKLWWDGDTLSEMLDNKKLVKWDYNNNAESRVYTFSNVLQVPRNVPGCYGDILGDWREEIVYPADDKNSLLIFTTTTPTSTRLYTLVHNPEYRLCLTSRGYYQSTMCDFYLGDGMSAPQTPNITYAGGTAQGARGDANGNGTVDIVDALLVAQYYVGLNPSGFVFANADANCSGGIDIVDALLVAQYYVGLVTTLC